MGVIGMLAIYEEGSYVPVIRHREPGPAFAGFAFN